MKCTHYNSETEKGSVLGYAHYLQEYILHNADSTEINNILNILDWVIYHANEIDVLEFIELLKQEKDKKDV